MSMPSSRLEVATTQGSRPRLRSSSISARCSLETEPWCARAMTGSAPGRGPGLPHQRRRHPSPSCQAVTSPGRRHRLTTRGAEGGAVHGDLVEPGGQPLGEPARVGEHDRGAVLLDQVDDPLLDVRPDRPAALGAAGRGALGHLVDGGGQRELGHVLDRDHDLEVPLLGGHRGDHLDGTGAAQEAGHLLDRPHGRGQADPLGRPLQQLVEPLQRERQVGAALGAGHGVHLVDDHRLHPAQRLPGLGGEHQEQRLGRGDQDVRGRGAQPAPVGGAGVARAQADGDVGRRHAEPVRGVPDAGQRRAQVALHVDGERLERGDVEHPAAVQLLLGRRGGGQPVDRPQERRERLARAGGGDHQRVAARRDRLPGADLGRGRGGERGLEPGAGGLAEGREDVLRTDLLPSHVPILPDGTDTAARLVAARDPADTATGAPAREGP